MSWLPTVRATPYARTLCLQRVVSEGVEDEVGGLCRPLERRQVTGPVELDEGGPGHSGSHLPGRVLQPVDVVRTEKDGGGDREAAQVDVVTYRRRRVGPLVGGELDVEGTPLHPSEQVAGA